jgi:formyltetrahydrofolate synthetase
MLAFQMAMVSDKVNAEMVQAREFPELSDQFHVHGVPHTNINHGAGEVLGSVPAADLIQEIATVLKK